MFLFFSLIRLSGPAYSAGLIGKAPPVAVECHSRQRVRGEGVEEAGEVTQFWPSPSVPGRPGRSVCGTWLRVESGRARQRRGARRGGAAPRASTRRAGASGM